MNSEEHFAPIAALDLNPIKTRLMNQESGEGWSREQADAAEFEYRRFLYIVKKFPNERPAPLLDVDVFWHYHILDTVKYATDCEAVFGYFLHHSPASGVRGEDDEADHQQTGARMRELYEATFGDAYIRQEEEIEATGSSRSAQVKTAWCTPATAKTAWCTPATAKTAWCTPATAKTAWCTPATAKAAWCTPATAKTAWCTPATAKTAWCTPATAKTAWCTPATAKTAWCTPATGVTVWPRGSAAQ